MASEMVRGRPIPLRVADHPGLEVCNTRAGWGQDNPKEYLTDYPTFLIWAERVGVIDDGAEAADLAAAAAADPVAAAAVLREVLAFRADLYAALTTRPVTVGVLEPWGKSAVLASALRRDPGGGWSWDGGPGLARPARRLALLAMSLLAEHAPEAVRRCGGNGCGWLFLDASGRRRWCVMAICGNRAKARRRVERLRSQP